MGGWVGGPNQEIIPLRGFILQAETCQILSLAENPRWSPSVAIKTFYVRKFLKTPTPPWVQNCSSINEYWVLSLLGTWCIGGYNVKMCTYLPMLYYVYGTDLFWPSYPPSEWLKVTFLRRLKLNFENWFGCWNLTHFLIRQSRSFFEQKMGCQTLKWVRATRPKLGVFSKC